MGHGYLGSSPTTARLLSQEVDPFPGAAGGDNATTVTPSHTLFLLFFFGFLFKRERRGLRAVRLGTDILSLLDELMKCLRLNTKQHDTKFAIVSAIIALCLSLLQKLRLLASPVIKVGLRRATFGYGPCFESPIPKDLNQFFFFFFASQFISCNSTT